MRLLLVRHADPDYVHDSLTEAGHREAQLLAEIADRWNMGTCYMSPLGRAQVTAGYSLEKIGKTAETLDWLREFPAEVDVTKSPHMLEAFTDTRKNPDGTYKKRIPWDMLPVYRLTHPELADPVKWRTSEVAACSDTVQVYDRVIAEFDAFLKAHGIVKDGDLFRIEKECSDTVTFFCHFGIACVLLSHLWSVSPFTLWHNLVLLPSSVTEIRTEERQKGIAQFRARRIGDLTHLTMAGVEPSPAASFCDVYSHFEERH